MNEGMINIDSVTAVFAVSFVQFGFLKHSNYDFKYDFNYVSRYF